MIIQTAFIDALRSGPTILVINKNQWRQKFIKNLLQRIRKKQVIFYSYDKALKHINDNWDNINKWWLSHRTKKSVSNFLSMMNWRKILKIGYIF